jgi:hypothetical protein
LYSFFYNLEPSNYNNVKVKTSEFYKLGSKKIVIIEIFQLISCLALGLLAGSLLTEGVILVPYWRTMEPKEFLSLHSSIGPRLFMFFAPLTISATVLPVLAAAMPFILGVTAHWLSVVPAIIALSMLAIYFAYFKGANESFESGSVGVDGLSEELAKWAKWHSIRVVLCLTAFFISLIVILL